MRSPLAVTAQPININKPSKVFISGSQLDVLDLAVPDTPVTSMFIIGRGGTSYNENYVQYLCTEKPRQSGKAGLTAI